MVAYGHPEGLMDFVYARAHRHAAARRLSASGIAYMVALTASRTPSHRGPACEDPLRPVVAFLRIPRTDGWAWKPLRGPCVYGNDPSRATRVIRLSSS